MIRVDESIEIGGIEYELGLKFTHITEGDAKNRGRQTVCEILAAPVGTETLTVESSVIGRGVTKVFSGNFWQKPDQYSRIRGRKEALKRALEDVGWVEGRLGGGYFSQDKTNRRKVWDSFKKYCKITDGASVKIQRAAVEEETELRQLASSD
jgi:hypothetical protein